MTLRRRSLLMSTVATLATTPAESRPMPQRRSRTALEGASLEEVPATALAQAMTEGRLTSEQLVQRCLARIATVDPRLHSVLALNPDAALIARRLDLERRGGLV